jgi:lipopolysaccharide export system protein LptA
MRCLWGALAVAAAVVSSSAAEAPQGGPAALNYDSSKPIQVNADTFAADLNQSTGTYRGNVVIVQGEVKLRADEVRVIAPDGKARRMEARGHIVVDSPSGRATGDTGVYDVAARVIHLTGRVVLTKGPNVMRGSALDVHVATGQARLVAATESGRPGRVQAVIYPNERQPKPEPARTPTPAQAP